MQLIECSAVYGGPSESIRGAILSLANAEPQCARGHLPSLCDLASVFELPKNAQKS
ncbi:5406_t:CDS:1, partial [Acaulospora colombiana]